MEFICCSYHHFFLFFPFLLQCTWNRGKICEREKTREKLNCDCKRKKRGDNTLNDGRSKCETDVLKKRKVKDVKGRYWTIDEAECVFAIAANCFYKFSFKSAAAAAV